MIPCSSGSGQRVTLIEDMPSVLGLDGAVAVLWRVDSPFGWKLLQAAFQALLPLRSPLS